MPNNHIVDIQAPKASLSVIYALGSFVSRVLRLEPSSASELRDQFAIMGIKLIILKVVLKRLLPAALSGRLFKGSLPGNLKILFRLDTIDIEVIEEVHFDRVYDRHYIPKTGDIVFDVGSHIGTFALKSSRLVGESGWVFAFEPEPRNFGILGKNIYLNDIQNVRTFNKAVSSGRRKVCLKINPGNTGGHTVQFNSDFEKNKAEIWLSSVTLDQIIEKYSIQKVNLLKMDVEKHELEVLKGANRFLSICDNVAIETHEKTGGPSNSEIIRFLRNYNFKTKLYSNPRWESNDMVYGWK
jgi:FkbM family methyltransferase